MEPRRVDASWLSLILRLGLAVYLVSAAASIFVSGLPPAAVDRDVPVPWLPGHAGGRVYAYAIALGLGGLLLAAGIRTARIAIGTALVLVAVHVEWLVRDHLYNSARHLLPFFGAAVLLAASAGAGDRFGADRWLRPDRFSNPDGEATWSWVSLLLRLFAGAIFLRQGLQNTFVTGPIEFAREVYVEGFAQHWMPSALLWVAGVLNPITELAAGACLLLGLKTRWSAVVLGLFLISIFFGHTMSDPFDRGPDVHDYAMANLAVVAAVLALVQRGNRFSLDVVLERRFAGGRRPDEP